MTSVKRVPLRNVLKLDLHRSPVEATTVYAIAGIYSFGRGLFERTPIDGTDTSYKVLHRLQAGQLVMSRLKAWEGALAVVDDRFDGWFLSPEFPTFTVDEELVDLRFLTALVTSKQFWNTLRDASQGIGARRERVHAERLLDQIIPLPPIDEQRRQALHLDRIGSQSRNVLETLAEQGPDAIIATLPPLIDEVVRQHTSVRTTVGELVDLVSDIVHPGDDLGAAGSFVGLQHVARHTGLRGGSDAVEAMKGRKFRFAPGDLVYGYLRPYLNKVWVADRHGLCSVDQYVLRPRATVDGELLAHILRGQAVLDRAIELTHSLQLPRLRSGLLMSLEVPVIADTAAEEVTRRLDGIRDHVVGIATARQMQIRTAEALMPAVLNQAFGAR